MTASPLPRVILHNAVSLDGRFDWFTPNIGLFYSLIPRWREDATLVGSGTILAAPESAEPEEEDAAEPTRPDTRERRPLLVIPDSRGRVRCWDALGKAPYWRGMIALCSRTTPKEYLRYLGKRRIDCIIAGRDHVDLRAALRRLRLRYGVKVVRVDSGGTLNGVLLRAGLVSEVSLLIHPALVGGMTPRNLFQAPDLSSPAGVIPLKLTGVDRLKGGAIWLRYRVVS